MPRYGWNEMRETLGREVRRVWIDWAREQPAPKPTWLVEWDDLSEQAKEVDRRIGETLARIGASTAEAKAEAVQLATTTAAMRDLRAERDELREKVLATTARADKDRAHYAAMFQTFATQRTEARARICALEAQLGLACGQTDVSDSLLVTAPRAPGEVLATTWSGYGPVTMPDSESEWALVSTVLSGLQWTLFWQRWERLP